MSKVEKRIFLNSTQAHEVKSPPGLNNVLENVIYYIYIIILEYFLSKWLKSRIDPALLCKTGEKFDNCDVASRRGGDLEHGARLGNGPESTS